MITSLLVAIAPHVQPIAPNRVHIFPNPSSVVETSGSFSFGKQVQVFASTGADNEARALEALLGRGGIKVSVNPPAVRAKRSSTVTLTIDPSITERGAEGYNLDISRNAISVRASGTAGLFYAIQTLRQMLPPEIEDSQKAISADWSLPCAKIVDQPKFQWRGMLLDVSRHFFPKPDIEHFLDLLAMHKMNVFHWHLVDDGGWRIEIKSHPNLTKIGAWRRPSKAVWDYQNLSFPGPRPGTRLYGGFYTQEDIKEIVKYAEARHITIVPEIEMPGHSLAAMSSYPELTCNVSHADYQKESGLPFPNVYCAGKEATFKFLQDVIDEVCELFPSKYIHIGGDEVDKFLWSKCPDCQARMKAENLSTPEELQSYFIRRMEKYINSKGKRLMGWDEILEGGLAPNAAVMSWRGIDGGIAAAKAGHDVVMTPTSHCYFDYAYSSISTEHVLEFQPVPSALTETEGAHILGGQCNLWTEWVPDRATAEQRLFPRILAMSEVLWSQHPDTDPDVFDKRLEPYYARLVGMGLSFYLPKPVAEFDAVILSREALVTFNKPPLPGAVIRYTTDGSEPTANSEIYNGPIDIATPCNIVAATFINGQRSESTTIGVAAKAPVDASLLVPGLDWRAYDGAFSVLPDFSKLKPSGSGEARTVDLFGNKKENYALEVSGYLKIDKEGVYRLYVSSDDGSALWISGAKVVDNDGLHGGIEKSGRVFLKPGIYPLVIGFFQAGGAQSLTASIDGPGMAKQSIPAAMLWHKTS